MKSVSYSVSQDDIKRLNKNQARYIGKCSQDYNSNPKNYGGRSLADLAVLWHYNGGLKSVFDILEADGLVSISKEEDKYYTFADHSGDCFNPVINSEIAPDELKRQERKERARFNRLGVWTHVLVVEGVEVDDSAIGGFVGNDFQHSGYDTEFYFTAIEMLKSTYPDYVSSLLSVAGIKLQ